MIEILFEMPEELRRNKVSQCPVTIGADPELFAFSKKTGMPVSVHDLIPGTKFQPFLVPRGGIQVDGTAAEFNITPAASREAFLESIRRVSEILSLHLTAKNSDLEFRITPTAKFDKKYFASLPHYARYMGCEPDWSAYTGHVNPKPETDEPFRAAGGHVHVGWVRDKSNDPHSGKHFARCCQITKELDFVLWNSSKTWDTDTSRREMYGKPGSFRPKWYGLEYRVLSNMWLSSQAIQDFVYSATKAVTSKILKGEEISRKFKTVVNTDNGYSDFCSFLESQNIPSTREYNL